VFLLNFQVDERSDLVQGFALQLFVLFKHVLIKLSAAHVSRMLTLLLNLVLVPHVEFRQRTEHACAVLSSAFLNGLVVRACIERVYLANLVLEVQALRVDLLHCLHLFLAKHFVQIYEFVVFILPLLRDQRVRGGLSKS
jgi:hypothetical protein